MIGIYLAVFVVMTLAFLLQGQASDIAIHAKEILKMREMLNGLYVHHTGQSKKRIGRRADYHFVLIRGTSQGS